MKMNQDSRKKREFFFSVQPKPNNLLLPTCPYEIKKRHSFVLPHFPLRTVKGFFVAICHPHVHSLNSLCPLLLQAVRRAVIFNRNSFNIPMCWFVAEVTLSGLRFSWDPPLDKGDVS